MAEKVIMLNHYKFSILIPAYNEEQSITSCLNSLITIDGNDKEIIVIDDASTDLTVQVIERFLDKGIILVKREKNGGRAAALNSGLQRATGDVIVTTDADTVVPSHWLKRFELSFNQYGVVAVGGAYQARNKDKPLANATSILDHIMNGIFRKLFVPNKLSGVNSAILRDTLLNLGGFSENSWWSEDSELGWKLKSTGRVIYDPENVVSTLYPDTWQDIWKRKFYWGYAMGLKFRERIPCNLKLWIRPMIFMALFLNLLLFLITIPYGINTCLVPCSIFLLLLSSLTIVYVPLGVFVMLWNGDRISLKTLFSLVTLPIVREFAYVYGMFKGYYKGRASAIKRTWKGEINHRDTKGAKKFN